MVTIIKAIHIPGHGILGRDMEVLKMESIPILGCGSYDCSSVKNGAMVLAPNMAISSSCYTSVTNIISRKVPQTHFPSVFCLSIIICYYLNLAD